MSKFKQHALYTLPLLSLLALSPGEIQKLAQRGLASEVPAQVEAKEVQPLTADIKPVEVPKTEVPKAEIPKVETAEVIKPEDKAKVEAKTDKPVVSEAKDAKPEEKTAKEEIKIVLSAEKKKEETKSEEKKDEKKDEKKKDDKKEQTAECDVDDHVKAMNAQMKELVTQQQSIMSYMNQMQQQMYQLEWRMLTASFNNLNSQAMQMPYANYYMSPGGYGLGNGMSIGGCFGGLSSGNSNLIQSLPNYNSTTSPQLNPNPSQTFQGMNPYSPTYPSSQPVSQPMGYWNNWGQQTQGSVDLYGYNMSSPINASGAPQVGTFGMTPAPGMSTPTGTFTQPVPTPAQNVPGTNYQFTM